MERAREIMSQVCGILDADGIKYRVNEDGTTIEAVFPGRTAPLWMRVIAAGEPQILAVVIPMPLTVPEERRVQMAETVVRANWGLLVGSFDLDMRDGELRYRAAIPMADATLAPEQFRDLMRASLWVANRYNRAFCRLLYGDDLSPAEVIAEAEMADCPATKQ